MDKIEIDTENPYSEVALIVGEETVYLTVEELFELSRVINLAIESYKC